MQENYDNDIVILGMGEAMMMIVGLLHFLYIY